MKNISRFALLLYTASEVAPHEGTRPTSSCRPGPLPRRRGLMTLSIALADVNYLSATFGELVCFDAASGQEQWRKDFKKDFGGSAPGWGFSESPLIDGDKVVSTPGGSQGAVVALNKKTGALIWQCKEFKDSADYASLI